MKRFFKQLLIASLVGFLSVGLEVFFGSKAMQNYIVNDGLTIIAALFAINAATLPSILSTLRDIETQKASIGAFKKTRSSAIQGLWEALVLGALFYVILAVFGDDLVFPVTKDITGYTLTLWIAGALARACIFLTAYNTYDFAKALVNISSTK